MTGIGNRSDPQPRYMAVFVGSGPSDSLSAALGDVHVESVTADAMTADHTAAHRPDVTVIDASDRETVDALEVLHSLHRTSPIVVLVHAEGSPDLAAEIARTGAIRVNSDHTTSEQLAELINELVRARDKDSGHASAVGERRRPAVAPLHGADDLDVDEQVWTKEVM